MSKRKSPSNGAMLELWRPPQGAGEPGGAFGIGCHDRNFSFCGDYRRHDMDHSGRRLKQANSA